MQINIKSKNFLTFKLMTSCLMKNKINKLRIKCKFEKIRFFLFLKMKACEANENQNPICIKILTSDFLENFFSF